MRIGILSDFASTGGASTAAARIAHALRQKGNTITRISSDGSAQSMFDEKTLFVGRKFLLINQCFRLIGKEHYAQPFRRNELLRQLEYLLKAIKPHAISIHNLHGASWPIELVRKALEHCPVIWTLHDCWSFLGSYYPSHSDPPPKSSLASIKRFWNLINNSHARHQLVAATPSHWMKNLAAPSHWKRNQVTCIPNPLPTNIIQELDPVACKKALGLPQNLPVALIIAGNLSEDRKGGAMIGKILAEMQNEKIQFLLVGNGAGATPENVKSLGFVNDNKLLNIIYCAADFLLHPAPIDNLPNTVAESLTAGTPVLAFAVGGIPEMVFPNKSGWLVKEYCHQTLLSKIKEIIFSHGYKKLRDSSRKVALERFDSDTVAYQYQTLIESTLKKYE